MIPETIIRSFSIQGNPLRVKPHGNGHINETYLVKTDTGNQYIFQKVNSHVFRDIHGLMMNMMAVTHHLAQKDSDQRHTVRIIRTTDGAPYLKMEDGDIWRVINYIENSFSPESANSAYELTQAGLAFGQFQNMLADFPAETLTETIPDFHNTPARFGNLKAAAEADIMGRLKNVESEYRFFCARKDECGIMTGMAMRGELPLRVTHNDTKTNNILLDKDTHEVLCVVDLDTVMPGLVANDFGDTVRFGASTAAEDEADLDKVSVDMNLYRAFAEAFIGTCGAHLTKNEVLTLPLGAKLMTLECGMRFLTDYLEGDRYFRIDRSEQNLERARTQIKLVCDMENKWEEMNKIVRDIYNDMKIKKKD